MKSRSLTLDRVDLLLSAVARGVDCLRDTINAVAALPAREVYHSCPWCGPRPTDGADRAASLLRGMAGPDATDGMPDGDELPGDVAMRSYEAGVRDTLAQLPIEDAEHRITYLGYVPSFGTATIDAERDNTEGGWRITVGWAE